MKVAVFCIKKDRKKVKTEEFHRSAKRVENKFEDTGHVAELYFVDSGIEILRILENYPQEYLDRIVLVGHGTPLWWGLPGKMGIYKWKDRARTISAHQFGEVVKNVTKQDAIISFASCLSAASPAWYRKRIFGTASQWTRQSHAPGGDRSICAYISLLSNREIRGHTTVGHTTENPAIRIFRAGSVIGTSAAKEINFDKSKERRKWNTLMKGEKAENILIGLEELNPEFNWKIHK